MSDSDFDLDAYLRRIGHAGPVSPDLPVLCAVIAAHAATIPFENIDVLLRRPVRIDRAAVQAKLVHGGRGGYCFEQNSLLRDALTAVGFQVTALLARVVRGQAPDAETPRSHMVLRVDLPEGSFLADVGFGNLTPTAPLRFGAADVQATPHEDFRLAPLGTPLGIDMVVEARVGDEWQALYRVPPDAPPPIDFEVSNWFTATFPASPFTTDLIIARPAPGMRRTLLNGRYAERPVDGVATVTSVDGADAWARLLSDSFGLFLSQQEVADVLAAIPAETAAPFRPFQA